MTLHERSWWKILNAPIVILGVTGVCLYLIPFQWSLIEQNSTDSFQYFRIVKELEYRLDAVGVWDAEMLANAVDDDGQVYQDRWQNDFEMLLMGSAPLLSEFHEVSLVSLLVNIAYLNKEANANGAIDKAVDAAVALQAYHNKQHDEDNHKEGPASLEKQLTARVVSIRESLSHIGMLPYVPPQS